MKGKTRSHPKQAQNTQSSVSRRNKNANVRKIFSPSSLHHHEWFISPFSSNNKNILKQTKRSICRMNLRQCFRFFLPRFQPFPFRVRWITLNRRFHFIRKLFHYDLKFSPAPHHEWAGEEHEGCFCFLCFSIFHALHFRFFFFSPAFESARCLDVSHTS